MIFMLLFIFFIFSSLFIGICLKTLQIVKTIEEWQ